MAVARTIEKPDHQLYLLQTFAKDKNVRSFHPGKGNDAPQLNHLGVSSPDPGIPQCCCSRQRLETRRRLAWGPLILRRRTTTDRYHRPGCTYANIRPNEVKCYYGVAYVGMTKFMNQCLEIAFSLTAGAGGSSISPVLTTFTMVDARRSPIFALTAILVDCSYSLDSVGSVGTTVLISSFLRRFWHSLKTGKASLNEYDNKGNTILHSTAYMMVVCRRCLDL